MREQFLAALSQVKSMEMMAATYRVRRGDTISKIASKYRVSQTELMRLNHIQSARSLQVGKVLRIPGRHRAVGGGKSESSPTSTRLASNYTVRRGDTLIAIANRHGVSVDHLQEWNGMGRRTDLRVGQTLKLYSGSESTTMARGDSSVPYGTHTVHAGEYPAKIARAYGMSLNEFLAANNLSKDSTIRIGQQVRVRGGATGSSPSAPVPAVTYEVRPGDTASSIARRHGIGTSALLAMNGLSAKSILRVGQELKVTGSSPQQAVKKHVVAKGHNPTTIARRYGVRVDELYEWNDWQRNHVLHIGDEVLIYD